MSVVYDVVLLAGGAAHRLGGADKPGLLVGDRTLLERVVDAAAGALRVVVVGPARTLPPGAGRPAVRWAQEQPPGAGPVAALQAGLAAVGAPVVVLLAADLPFVSVAAVEALAGAVRVTGDAGGSGAVVLDGTGREQWLLSAWPAAALRAALVGAAPDAALRSVLAGLPWVGLSPVATAGDGEVWYDCDTFAELAEARQRATHPTVRDGAAVTTEPTVQTWAAEVAAALGLVDDVPVARLLDVARDAAHRVQRPAAPITTFLVGLAVGRGMDLDQACRIVEATLPAEPSLVTNRPVPLPPIA